MSFWPEAVEYAEAVQSPQTSFSDPELRSATAEMSMLGPLVCSGNFASVYHLIAADGRQSWAIKCFTKRVTGQQSRHLRISDHLHAANLECAVDFQYLTEGIRIRGEWFPILKMDWVEGLTLFDFVDRNIEDHRYIGRLYSIWLRLEPYLRATRTVHGDLQHGNVLLVPGQTQGKLSLRVIDYDGLWTPDLATSPSGEAGHSAYQHPERQRRRIYSNDIDRFPHLVIAAALRSLSRPNQADLWRRYQNGDNLLFTKRDFENPGASELLHQLWTSGSSELQNWAGLIAVAATSPLEATPRLDGRLSDGKLSTLSTEELARARELLGPPASAPTQSKPEAETTENWWQQPLVDDAIELPVEADTGQETDLLQEFPNRRQRRRKTKGGEESRQVVDSQPNVDRIFLGISAGIVGLVLFVGLAIVFAGRGSGNPQSKIADQSPNLPAPVAVDSKNAISTSEWTTSRQTLTDDLPFYAAVFVPGTDRLVSAGADGATLWDLESGTALKTLPGYCMNAAISGDGTRVALDFSSIDKIWDAGLDQQLQEFADDNVSGSRSLIAFSNDGLFMAVQSRGHIRILDLITGKTISTAGGTGLCAFSPDGRLALLPNHVLLDLQSRNVVKTLSRMTVDPERSVAWSVGVKSMAFSSDGKTIATGYRDGRIFLWDVQSGYERHILNGHSRDIASVTFSPDGQTLASGSWDSTIKLWEVSTGKLKQTIPGHRDLVYSVAYSSDGRSLASTSADGTLRIWGPGPLE